VQPQGLSDDRRPAEPRVRSPINSSVNFAQIDAKSEVEPHVSDECSPRKFWVHVFAIHMFNSNSNENRER
jgi:hypothetical protein